MANLIETVIDAGAVNATNDASLYIVASNNNDWGLRINKYNNSATEYGARIEVGSSAGYALQILGNGSETLRIYGSGAITTQSSVDINSGLYLRNSLYVLNAAGNGWQETIVRNSGSPYFANNVDGGTFLASNAAENNNWLFQENARGWGLYYFNRGTESGQTIGTYSTVGAETFFIGQNAGITMPSGWTGYNASSKIAAMISNYNGYIYSASTVFAATSLRSPIFYDSDNANYYLDPASTSNINNLTVAGSLSEGGYTAYPERVYTINFSAQSTTVFYPVVLDASPGESTNGVWHHRFSVEMPSQGGGVNFNNHTLVAEVRGQGWSDQTLFYRAFHTYYDTGERSILGIWRGTQAWYGVVVYLRGGQTYYVRTNSRSVTGYTSAVTLNSSATFALKDYTNADVSGTSANISEMLNLFNNASGFYHSNIIIAPSMYAARFYDNDNSTYYLDPASTSNLNGLTVASTITGSITGNAGTVTNGVYTNIDNVVSGTIRIDNISNSFVNTVATANRSLTIYQNTVNADAYMTFHIGSDYAGYFGLGGAENDLVWGGWSVGNNRYRILHSGNQSYAWNLNQNLRTTDSPSFVRLTSTQSTGTSPFTVSSTTVVSNLNSDLLDGQHGSYYQDPYSLILPTSWRLGIQADSSITPFLFGTFGDLLAFRTISNLQYWDGSAWQTYNNTAIQSILTGNIQTYATVAPANRKFRFEFTAADAYIGGGILVIHQQWNIGAHQVSSMLEYYNGTSWVTVIPERTSAGGEVDYHFYNRGDIHGNWTQYRVTITGADTVNSASYTGIQLLYDYTRAGLPNNFLPITWDYARNVTAAGSLRAPIFYDSANTAYYLDPAGSTSLLVAGNVGIGTTSPTYQLEVYKTTNDAVARVRTTGAGAYLFLDSASDGYFGTRLASNGTEKWFLGGYGTSDLQIKRGTAYDGTEVFRITTTGNVGIGTTSPSYKLYVNGSFNFDISGSLHFRSYGYGSELVVDQVSVGGWARSNRIYNSNYTAGTSFFGAFGSEAAITYAFWTLDNPSSVDITGYNSTQGIFLRSAGQVGVGINNPSYRFDVNGTSGFRDAMYFGPNQGLISWGSFGGGTGFGIRGESGKAFSLGANGSWDHITINTSGSVGIGSTSPGYPLEVVGNARISGGLINAGLSAQWSLSGGGTATFNSSGYISWDQRVIAIPVEKTEFSADGYIDITCPTSGTITYYNSSNVTTTVTCTAAGIPIAAWEALYYEVTPGQSSAFDQTKFRLVNYQNSTWRPSSNWLLLCVRNGDTTPNTLKWIPGQANIPVGGKYDFGQNSVYFNATTTYLRSENNFWFLTNAGAAQAARFSSIQLSDTFSGTIPANGILFGTDTNIYRSAANTLKTDDDFIANSLVGIGGSTAASRMLTINNVVTTDRPAIKIVNPNFYSSTSSTGRTFYRWMPIDIDGTTYWIPIYSA